MTVPVNDPTLIEQMRRKQLETGDAFAATLSLRLYERLASEFSDPDGEADVQSRRMHWRVGAEGPFMTARFRATWTVIQVGTFLRGKIVEGSAFAEGGDAWLRPDRLTIPRRTAPGKTIHRDVFIKAIIEGVAARWSLAEDLWQRFYDALAERKIALIGLRAESRPGIGDIVLTAIPPVW